MRTPTSVKDSSLQELVTAIKTIGEGASYVDPRVAASASCGAAVSSNRSTNELSPREREIIRLIAQGLSESRHRPTSGSIGEDDQESRKSHIFEDSLHRAFAGGRSRDQDRPSIVLRRQGSARVGRTKGHRHRRHEQP